MWGHVRVYIVPTNQRWAYFMKPRTHLELLPDWAIYLTVLSIIGRLKMN
jgi:hypothetical protein